MKYYNHFPFYFLLVFVKQRKTNLLLKVLMPFSCFLPLFNPTDISLYRQLIVD